MLTEAAIMGKKDELRGLKENVNVTSDSAGSGLPALPLTRAFAARRPGKTWVPNTWIEGGGGR